MGVVHFGELKLRQQEVEVKALIALMKYGNEYVKSDATKALRCIAFPELLADKINQEIRQKQLELQ